MKFSHKIVLATSIIIALCFSLGGTYMIQRNFNVAYEGSVDTNTRQHIMSRYSLESNLKNAVENGQEFDEDLLVSFAAKLDSYGRNKNDMMILDEDGQSVYSNMGGKTARISKYLKASDGQYYIYESGGKHLMLVATNIEVSGQKAVLLNRYDISGVYAERNRQIGVFIRIDIVIVLLSVLLTYFISNYLTRKIETLSRVSTEIAQGDYSQRTNIKSSDEIGQLSQNFDVMAGAVEERVAQLEEDLQIRESFVADFSHELSTPMTSIMGYSQLLMQEIEDEALRRKGLGYIYGECRRLETLSKKMMQMMRITDEKLTLQILRTGYLAEQVEILTSSRLKNTCLKMQVSDCPVEGDSSLLVTLLRNLIENADRACGERAEEEDGNSNDSSSAGTSTGINGSDESLPITVTGKAVGGVYEFCVEDRGCGIPEVELEKLTQAFYRIDKSRSRQEGGNGLGLAICKRICLCHGSDLKIESRLGEGSKFSFDLMIASEDEDRTGGCDYE